MISLSNGRLLFPYPEERIREYCELEVYRGYDDFHSIDNTITRKDIEATKRIFSMIDQHGHSESISILNSPAIPRLLSRVPDKEIGDIPDPDWHTIRENIASLFDVFHDIDHVGLAKTAKILHLKRPRLFPILDSYVVEFLTGTKLSDVSHGHSLTDLGMRALEIARKDMIGNLAGFKQLQQVLGDLPISLTIARMYDILCWTTWKWDILGNRKTTRWVPAGSGFNRETGYASKTLLNPERLKRIKIPLPHAPALRSAGFTQKGSDLNLAINKLVSRIYFAKNPAMAVAIGIIAEAGRNSSHSENLVCH
jgi:hypothetical protein